MRSAATSTQGYVRIKLKIEPGWDVEPVRAVRERFGDDVLLQVDANTAYTARRRPAPGPARRLRPAADRAAAAPRRTCSGTPSSAKRCARRSAWTSRSSSARAAADAIALGACSIVNIKPGRVGGYLEARRIHDVCAAHGVAVWCGGMLETGLGRAANVALAALPGLHAAGGHLGVATVLRRTDITAPFVLDGRPSRRSRPAPGSAASRCPTHWRSSRSRGRSALGTRGHAGH